MSLGGRVRDIPGGNPLRNVLLEWMFPSLPAFIDPVKLGEAFRFVDQSPLFQAQAGISSFVSKQKLGKEIEKFLRSAPILSEVIKGVQEGRPISDVLEEIAKGIPPFVGPGFGGITIPPSEAPPPQKPRPVPEALPEIALPEISPGRRRRGRGRGRRSRGADTPRERARKRRGSKTPPAPPIDLPDPRGGTAKPTTKPIDVPEPTAGVAELPRPQIPPPPPVETVPETAPIGQTLPSPAIPTSELPAPVRAPSAPTGGTQTQAPATANNFSIFPFLLPAGLRPFGSTALTFTPPGGIAPEISDFPTARTRPTERSTTQTQPQTTTQTQPQSLLDVAQNLSPSTASQPRTAAQEATRKCEQVKRRRKKKNVCAEGFFEDLPGGKTNFITWREVDCRTRKTKKEKKRPKSLIEEKGGLSDELLRKLKKPVSKKVLDLPTIFTTQ